MEGLEEGPRPDPVAERPGPNCDDDTLLFVHRAICFSARSMNVSIYRLQRYLSNHVQLLALAFLWRLGS